MPKGTEIRIGPWTSGINLLNKPDQIQDDELVSCLNFDIDNSGLLEPRRPLRYIPLAGTNAKSLLASVILDNENAPKAMVGSYDAATDTTSFHAIGDPTGTIQNFSATATGTYTSVVQYQKKFWYVPEKSTGSGRSSPSNLTNTMTTNSDIPYGDYAFVLKDRMFVVRKSTSELHFSTPTVFSGVGQTTFTAPWTGTAPNSGGVIQINPGDNSPITKVVSLNNQVIIFKRDSTYILSFTNGPLTDGVVRQVSADQGAIDAITYNNEVYCYNSRSVFKFVNGFFQDIGLQLNLPDKDTIDGGVTFADARINVIGKTLLFGKTPSGNVYAMNLDTGAWTMYSFPDGSVSISTGTVFSRSSQGTAIFFGDRTAFLSYMLVAKTGRTDLKSDNTFSAPEYAFRTKEYNFDDSETWKRVYSWHLDSSFSTSPMGNALTYINGVINNTSTDTVDLVGSSLSYRFKTTSMGYSAAAAASSANAMPGPVIRGIRAVVGAKAPVSV